ncbi:MAG: hypothetical protein AB1452_15355 [Pseudomonadota bacterium]
MLVGLLLGAGLLLFEYTSAQKAARDRAKKMARKQELNQDERARLRNMMTFGFFILPPLMAAIFWLTM